MAGIYGNSKEDRHFERMLDHYLDEQDEDVDGLTPAQHRKIEREECLVDATAGNRYDNSYDI